MRSRLWLCFDVIMCIVGAMVAVDIYQRMVSVDDLQAKAPYVAAQPSIEARFLALEARVDALEAAR